MGSNSNTGEYYFPRVYKKDGQEYSDPGITLRDWFAGMAMQGLAITVKASRESMHPTTALEIARSAYHVADIMLRLSKERTILSPVDTESEESSTG